MKALLVCLALLVLAAGCTQPTKYVCADGQAVDDPQKCAGASAPAGSGPTAPPTVDVLTPAAEPAEEAAAGSEAMETGETGTGSNLESIPVPVRTGNEQPSGFKLPSAR